MANQNSASSVSTSWWY